jgi:non-specific serine/threonine protein kinase/serine/threonine-protein kinase
MLWAHSPQKARLEGKGVLEAARLIREEEPDRLGSVSRLFRGDIETIVGKALERDKSRRYQSAQALAEDIRRYLQDEPIAARPASQWYQVRKFVKRNKVVVGAAAGVGIALILGLVGTSLGLLRAREAKTLAELREQDAKIAEARFVKMFQGGQTLARAFIDELPEKIGYLPGSTDAQQFILATGLPFLELLSTEARDDLGIQRQVAQSYARMGELQWSIGQPNLNERDSALASFQRAIEITDHVLQMEPGDPRAELIQAEARQRRAGALQAVGNSEEASAERARGMAIYASLAGAHPELAEKVAIGRVNLKMQSGDSAPTLDIAYKEYAESLEIIRRARETDPSSLVLRRAEAVLASRVGNTQANRGDPKEALKTQLASLDIFEKIAAENPRDARAKRDICVSLEKMAGLQRKIGKHADALDNARRSLSVREDLQRADPFNEQASADVSAAHELVGQFLLEFGRTDEAENAFASAIKVRRRLAETDPSNRLFREWLSQSLISLGDCLANPAYKNRDDPVEGLKHYQEALSIRRPLFGESDVPRELRLVNVALDRVGTTLLQLNDDEGAPARFEEIDAICDRIHAIDPAEPRYAYGKSLALEKISGALRRLRRIDEAIEKERLSVKYAEEHLRSTNGDSSAREDLGEALAVFGELLQTVGSARSPDDTAAIPNLEEAKQVFTRALGIYDELAASGALAGPAVERPGLIKSHIKACDAELARRKGGPAEGDR